jgi:hypothetical protein
MNLLLKTVPRVISQAQYAKFQPLICPRKWPQPFKILNKCVQIFASVIWFFTLPVIHADSVTFYFAEDATISEKSLDAPLGSDVTLDAGTTGPNEGVKINRGLLKFDLSAQIPSNAIVTSASLKLTLVTTPTLTNLWFNLHKLLQSWDENAVTWTNRLFSFAPWNTPGAAPPLDYVSSVTQSNLIISTTIPATFTFASNPTMVADVQEWVSAPANNFGWILICDLEELERSVRKFASSERTSTNQRPSLEVQFTLPSSSSLQLTALPLTNGQFQFQFPAESNKNYTVLYTYALAESNWVVLTNIASLPAEATLTVSDTITESNRFYRVLAP